MSPDGAENCPPLGLAGLSFVNLNKLYSFILHVADLGLWQQEAPVQREGHDVGGDLAPVLLRLEGHNDLVIGVGDELEGGEAMCGDHLPHVADGDVTKVLGGAQKQVGALVLVVLLAVPLVAGPAWQEEPPLQRVTPASRLVNEVAWGHTTDPQVTRPPGGLAPPRAGRTVHHTGACPWGLLPCTGFPLPTLRGGLSRPLGQRACSIFFRPPSVLQAFPAALVLDYQSNKDNAGHSVPDAPSLDTCGHEFCLHF